VPNATQARTLTTGITDIYAYARPMYDAKRFDSKLAYLVVCRNCGFQGSYRGLCVNTTCNLVNRRQM